ncbi:MAG: PAS domain-containing protein, partial [Hyphomicrobiales bacterium]|nr:PAS domain-containing protein [Hyphomicrobiales bacterium]
MSVSVENSTALDEVPVPEPERRDFFRYVGFAIVVLALASATATFAVLAGLTPIAPTENVVLTALSVNGVLVLALFGLIAKEVGKLWAARRRRRAASQLHVRIVTLFSIIAAIPAILVAVAASITLDRGLDRWFSTRTQSIIGTSLAVAQAYVREHAQTLRGEVIAMAADIDRVEPYYDFDREQFREYFEAQAQIRGLVFAALIKTDGTEMMQVKGTGSEAPIEVPPELLDKAVVDQPLMIAPGDTNQVGAVIKLKAFENVLLYLTRAIDPRITQYLRITEANAAEYKSLEARRYGVQIAFGLMYTGIALIMLLAAIWLGIGFANQLVSPIRRLIYAADQVALGNLYVQVPMRREEGDLANLGSTFNKMTSELRQQRDELLAANEQLDERHRFTEAVLAGVTAGVVGADHRGTITLVNRSAQQLLGSDANLLLGKVIQEAVPELGEIFSAAVIDPHRMHTGQTTLQRLGTDRTINVRVTTEQSDQEHGYVITLDDITDLVAAQRTSAWADVARRIAHEIKNPL